MAYKESNPAMVHIVQFIILLSVMALLHLMLAIIGLNTFITITTENPETIFPSMIIGYILASCMFPYVIPIYFIVVFSVSLIRRGVYGERHAKNVLRAFFIGILGMIIPPIIGGIFLMFIEMVEDIYVIIPIFIHAVPILLVFAMYLFVKDIGGNRRGIIGVIIFTASSVMLAMTEFVGLLSTINEEFHETFLSILFLAGTFMAIGALVGLIMMIVAFVDASKWTKAHKPLMDTQQKEQLEMQQNQIKMQIEQLKLQQEQLELQKQSMEMLGDIRRETITEGREMIPEGSKENDEIEWS